MQYHQSDLHIKRLKTIASKLKESCLERADQLTTCPFAAAATALAIGPNRAESSAFPLGVNAPCGSAFRIESLYIVMSSLRARLNTMPATLAPTDVRCAMVRSANSRWSPRDRHRT